MHRLLHIQEAPSAGPTGYSGGGPGSSLSGPPSLQLPSEDPRENWIFLTRHTPPNSPESSAGFHQIYLLRGTKKVQSITTPRKKLISTTR